ncbi:MAG: Xaa-Pro peptidase family protein [Gammaproteobacteria bacterium]|nr:Xaa-Pro peptidase family protein [Gammaproteobacteria bacterium]
MQEHEIDVVLLTTEADVRYYSGFHTQFWQSPTRPWFLCIPVSGKPIAVIPSIGKACMQNTWLDDIRTWSSPHPTDDGIGLLADTLMEIAGSKGYIGTPMCRETQLRLPLSEFESLKNRTTGCKYVDAGALIIKQRQIKSANEIAKIRTVCAMASNAFAELPHHLEVGLTTIEVFRRFKLACLAAGVDDTTYLVGSADQGGYDDIISPPTSHELAEGDVLILDTGCVWDGYFCDFDRNFLIGGRADAQAIAAVEAHQIVWDATEVGLTTAKPGISCAELCEAMSAVMRPHQKNNNSVGRLGHGLGMQLTEPPSLTEFDRCVLEPNMVLTLEPGYSYAPGKMMVHEENIVITETGAELLTQRAPRDLPIVR